MLKSAHCVKPTGEIKEFKIDDVVLINDEKFPRHFWKLGKVVEMYFLAGMAQIAPSLGAPVSSRTIRRCLAEGHVVSRRPLRVLPLTPTHRRLRLEWCIARGYWSIVKWNQVVFSDEFGFNLSSDDNRVRVWRPRHERLNPAFALQRHTTPTDGVMV
ncbi:transposable element Tcb2 transposase [Trichonephila clavipes]|nr:transposable element Tcb2 transposase [Trichonephila clavipes]